MRVPVSLVHTAATSSVRSPLWGGWGGAAVDARDATTTTTPHPLIPSPQEGAEHTECVARLVH
jgi:hypothetical protein